MIGIIIMTVILTWVGIAIVTSIDEDESFAMLPITFLHTAVEVITLPMYSIFYGSVTQKRYEEIRACDFYKKRLGKSFHLVTIYASAGDKDKPLYKRMLSHVYLIIYMRVKDSEV